MAADIETLRILIGDRKKVAVNENVGVGDGSNAEFLLDMHPLVSGAGGAGSGTLMITVGGTTATTSTYTITGANGRIVFSAGNEPAAAANILASYEYHAMSSGELSDFLSGHTGQPFLAAANACLGLAGDSSKLFMYIMGEKTVDKRKIAEDLRELSTSLLERHERMKEDSSYTATVWTMKDASGAVYDGYDTAAAVYTTTGI